MLVCTVVCIIGIGNWRFTCNQYLLNLIMILMAMQSNDSSAEKRNNAESHAGNYLYSLVIALIILVFSQNPGTPLIGRLLL